MYNCILVSCSECPTLSTKVHAIMSENGLTDEIVSGQKCGLLLEKTNFYAESGGQVS